MKVLGSKPYTVTRYAAVTYTSHRPVAAVESTFTIHASVQPLSGDEVQLLGLGDRVRKTRKAYTATLLRTVDEAAEKPADEISISGTTYEVHSVETQTAVIPHYKVILMAKQI